jgi:hypothetical protein
MDLGVPAQVPVPTRPDRAAPAFTSPTPRHQPEVTLLAYGPGSAPGDVVGFGPGRLPGTRPTPVTPQEVAP